MPIQTQRLILRVFTDDDFEMLRELDSDPAVLRYRSRRQIDPEMTRQFLEQAQRVLQDSPRLFFAYAVVHRHSQDWLGQCGLTALTPEVSEAFAWYSLLPRHWGQGYMSEAVSALLYAGASKFHLQRVLAECHSDNRASIRVMEKAGMRYEGRVLIPNTKGENEDRIRYGLQGDELQRMSGTNITIEPPI